MGANGLTYMFPLERSHFSLISFVVARLPIRRRTGRLAPWRARRRLGLVRSNSTGGAPHGSGCCPVARSRERDDDHMIR
jgi:hypothetical protein